MGIPSTIRTGAEKLFTRLERPGKIVAGEQFQELRDHPGANVPAWLIELMAEFPFAGIEIGVKVTDAFAGFEDEPVMFEWGDAALMKEINTQSYPGMYLFPHGYIALGCGVEWAGNILVMATNSEDPPLYEVWHDVSHDPVELESIMLSGGRGTRLISPTLSELLSGGLAEPPMSD